MLYKTYWLLNSNPQILKRYQKQFQYILCDEAQDNNFAQYELLKLLAEPQNNIFIVGDDDQSIYKFRGAVPEKFIGFKDEFDTKIINLQENYRSKPYILQTANKLIKNNKIRVPKELIPFRKDDNEVACYVLTANEDAEANVVVKKILELEKTNKSFNHMAILYRTNAQARAMEDQLISNGIPYVIFNGISFYERSEVKDIMAYLKLAASNNNNDNESLERIINKPSRYLGAKFMESVKEYAKNNKCNYFQAICSMNHRGRTANNVRSFIKTIIDIQDAIRKAMTQGDSVGNMIEETIRISNFKDYLSEEGQDEEDNIRIENLKSLITAGSRYFDAESFIKYTDLVSNASKDKNIEAVKLMTIHKSKGLEEDMIFIIGASEGLLPHRHAIDENDMAIEEERRLMYVAITRAKDYLLVTSPKSYQGRSLATSRFIKEAEFKDITDELSEAAVEKSDN
jgi:DNA helicase-2/ATP-dependent DNA helicase PcrA